MATTIFLERRMMKKLFGLSLSLLGVAAAAAPASASTGTCPGQIYWTDPWNFCTLQSGTDCSSCTYSCTDGTHTWNMCSN